MPANPGDEPRRQLRAPREWTGLDTPHGFERCVRATLRELYGYVALLSGRDRREAERLVGDVYRSLFRAVRAGRVEAVTLGALRSAGRRTWLDAHREELAAIDEVSRAPASTIAELSSLERVVLVLRHVNGMSVERAAAELGRSARDVAALDAHAVRRLRGTADASGAWLRAYLGPSVTPAAGLVDRIVRRLGDDGAPASTGVVDAESMRTSSEPAPLLEHEPVPEPEAAPGPEGAPEPEAAPGLEGAPEPEAASEHGAVPERDATPDLEPEPAGSSGAETPAGEPAAPHGAAPEELPTAELAVVDRPTVEIPALVRDGVGVEPGDGDGRDLSADDGGTPPPSADVVAVASGAEPEPAVGHRRPRWVVGIGGALLLLLVIALVWLALRGDAGDTVESVPATTAAAPATSAPPAPTSSAPAAAPSTTVAAGPAVSGFDPPCAERSGGEPAEVAWSDSFGPLAAEPALVVTLPWSVDESADPDRAPARTSTVLREDGAVLAVRPAEGHRSTQTVVARIGLDGAVAWVRCFDGDVTIGTRPDAGVDLALRSADEEATWSVLSLDDGALGEPLDADQSAALEAPPTTAPESADGPTLGFSYDGELGRSVPAGLEDGRVVWTASDVLLPQDGSFRATVVDGVVLAQTCAEVDGSLDCSAGELRGYDLGSGEQLWARPGAHDVPVSGDGTALVGDGSVWELVDVTTGAVVAGQRWDDPDTFAVDPDAGDGVAYLERRGGALVVARDGSVSIWLPAGAATGGADVSIP